jgi:signal transduction histidine kinase
VKLWLYFALFAAVLMAVLWLMQIVFLQSFYERMKTSDVKKIAATIVREYGSADFADTLDELTFRNAVLVVIRDARGEITYFSDEHNGQNRPRPQFYGGEPLPGGGDRRFGKSLSYEAAIPGGGTVLISTPLEPLNATTGILRTQLLYVTAASLLISLVIAFFISRKFSRPISGISQQAARLAGGDFDVTFDKGFCAELDELSATLDDTAAQLARVETLRRELLANISHDLRTPLTMIKAYSEMIRDISGENREKREEHLSVITRETDRLAALVDDILDLSAIQAGGETLTRENLNLSETVKSTLAQFAPLFEREGVAVTAAVEPDQYALADGKRLTQVLYNLIGNALSHVGADKALSVRLADLGAWVRFEVTDNGEGIAPEDLPLIWDRYYTSKSGAASGLGLSIAKSILEAHGARYGADSAPHLGSTFWFEIKK